jgi:hypothetical protein
MRRSGERQSPCPAQSKPSRHGFQLSPSERGKEHAYSSVIRFVFTVVFGFLWWWVYNRVGAALEYLVILGSVLAVCVCCCKAGAEALGEWSFDRYLECVRRCGLVTVVLMIGLFIVAILVAWVDTGAFPAAAALVNMVIAAIGAPLFVRAICCAYES